MNKTICLIVGVILSGTVNCGNINNKCHTDKIKRHRRVCRYNCNKNYIVSHVTVTCYRPLRKECNSQPFITSDGSRINLKHLEKGHLKWCAVSRDLLFLFPSKGKKIIWIEGFGLYEVRDVMNKRYRHHIDILIHPKDSMRIKLKNIKIKIYK